MSETLEPRRWGARAVSVVHTASGSSCCGGPGSCSTHRQRCTPRQDGTQGRGPCPTAATGDWRRQNVITFGAPLYPPTSRRFMNSFLFENIKDYIQSGQPRLPSRNGFKMCLRGRADPRRENANALNHSSEGSAPGRQELRVLPQKIPNQFLFYKHI